jgi:hypothetical protein
VIDLFAALVLTGIVIARCGAKVGPPLWFADVEKAYRKRPWLKKSSQWIVVPVTPCKANGWVNARPVGLATTKEDA